MLIRDMREGIEVALGSQKPGVDPMIARLAMGEAFANQIANAYFAICDQCADLDDEERQVAIRLKSEVHDTIKDRNDFAHGDWHIGNSWVLMDAKTFDPRLIRTKPGRRAGATVEMERSVAEIDALAEAVSDLDGGVCEFGWLCFGSHPLSEWKDPSVRVRDIFRFQTRKGVLREGRYADEPLWPDNY